MKYMAGVKASRRGEGVKRKGKKTKRYKAQLCINSKNNSTLSHCGEPAGGGKYVFVAVAFLITHAVCHCSAAVASSDLQWAGGSHTKISRGAKVLVTY